MATDYAARARFYDVEYRTTIDQPLLRSLVTDDVHDVLEIPCGAGRNLDWLVQTERQVVCADLEPRMVERVDERIGKLGAGGRVTSVVADMCELDLGRRFDLILVPQEAFQLLPDIDDALRALSSLEQHLTRRGTLLVDLYSFPARDSADVDVDVDVEIDVRPDYFDPTIPDAIETLEWTRSVPGGSLTRRRIHWRQGETVLVEFRYTLHDGRPGRGWETSWTARIVLRTYTFEQFEQLVLAAGLRFVDVFCDYDRRPYVPGSARAIALLGSTARGSS